MALVERRLDSGLVLSELGMDGAAFDRELKKRDPLLELQGWPSQTHGCIIWRVVRAGGSGRDPELVCVWQSDRGEPYPLSSGLLDKVDRLDRNTRSTHLTDAEMNDRHRAELAKQRERDDEALRDDWIPKHGRPVLPRSQSLRMSRDKRRARGERI